VGTFLYWDNWRLWTFLRHSLPPISGKAWDWN